MNTLSRRRFCLCCVAAGGLAATGGWLSPPEAVAEARNIVDGFRDDAARARITVHRLRRGISVLEGSGGNIVVSTGRDGKVFVDAGITGTKRQIIKAADSLSRDPITTLINTHWHFDHSDGNEWIGAEGASIVAHANTQKHLLSVQRVEDWDFTFPSSPLAAIPTVVFSDSRELRLNDQDIILRHYGPAHTDSDISVTFAGADILHCGDTFWNGLYPFIDYSTGGSIDGMIAAATANVTASGKSTIVVPGHGNPVASRSDLIAYRDMLVGIRENVAKLKRQGLAVDEAIAARPTQAYDVKWGKAVISPAFFTRLVYEGL